LTNGLSAKNRRSLGAFPSFFGRTKLGDLVTHPINLVDALAAAPGDRPFVTFWIDEDEQETITFAEFRNRAAVQAGALQARDINAGDRVIIIMPQSIAAMTTFVAAMMLGAVPAFLAYPNFKVEPSKYRDGLIGVTSNLNAKAVIIDDEFPDDLLGHISLGAETRLFRPSDHHEMDTDTESGLPGRVNSADDLAFIQHSAGTTGLQKGVALTHGAVLQQTACLARTIGIDGATDSIYSWLPLYHDMGLIACFMLPMVCHVPVVMQSPLDWVMHPETMLQIISNYRCTLAWMPNFAFQFVPRRSPPRRWAKCDLSSLRAIINCSEPVQPCSFKEFQTAFAQIGLKQSALQSSYAMAENVFAVTQSDIRRTSGPLQFWADGRRFRSEHHIVPVEEGTPGAISFASSGRALPGNELRIASDSGNLLPDGQVGEILLKSDTLFTGYYNRPDLTAKAVTDGWYNTGDLGFLLDGELFVVGRKKDLLIVGGENLYPQDIEELVTGHPAIHDGRVVAMGMFNPDLGTEDIVVVAEVQSEELLADSAEIEREIRNRIVQGVGVAVREVFLKPPKWIVKSTAGKPARSATREKLLKEHAALHSNAWETHSA
jgi:acyl-CoA synthetase (AMP-forming)/AMP-acid ligase II